MPVMNSNRTACRFRRQSSSRPSEVNHCVPADIVDMVIEAWLNSLPSSCQKDEAGIESVEDVL